MARMLAVAVAAVLGGIAAWASFAVVLAVIFTFLLPRFVTSAEAQHAWLPGFLAGVLLGAPIAGVAAGAVVRAGVASAGPQILWVANPAAWLTLIGMVWLLLAGQSGSAFALTLPGGVLAAMTHTGLWWTARARISGADHGP
jgi:hypothetical protein